MSLLRALFLLGIPALLPAQKGFPFQQEQLRYSVNWPSGLSLGEGQFSAKPEQDGWDFRFTLTAAIPVFSVEDRFRATADRSLCSIEFEKEIVHGRRKTREETRFEQDAHVARRITLNGGGKSEFSIPPCAKDALTFLYLTRRELGQGRVPPAQTVYFGSGYEVRLNYTGAQQVAISGKSEVADRLTFAVKGPKSDWAFEAFFARDAARTPLIVRVPFSLGTFSLELVR